MSRVYEFSPHKKSHQNIYNKLMRQIGIQRGGGALIISDYTIGSPRSQLFSEQFMRTFLAGLPVTHWPQLFGRDKDGSVKILSWPGVSTPESLDCGGSDNRVAKMVIPITLDETGAPKDFGKPEIIPVAPVTKVKEEYQKNNILVFNLYILKIIRDFSRKFPLPSNPVCALKDYVENTNAGTIIVPIKNGKQYGEFRGAAIPLNLIGSVGRVNLGDNVRQVIYNALINCKGNEDLDIKDVGDFFNDFVEFSKQKMDDFKKIVGEEIKINDDEEIFIEASIYGNLLGVSVVIINSDENVLNCQFIDDNNRNKHFIIIIKYGKNMYNIIYKNKPSMGAGRKTVQFLMSKTERGGEGNTWDTIKKSCGANFGTYTINRINVQFP